LITKRLWHFRHRLLKFMHRQAVILYLASLAAAVAAFIGVSFLLDNKSSHRHEELFSQQQETQIFLARQAIFEHFESLFQTVESLTRTVIPPMLRQQVSAYDIRQFLLQEHRHHRDFSSFAYLENKQLEPTRAVDSSFDGATAEGWAQTYGRRALACKEGLFIPPLHIRPDRQTMAILAPVTLSNGPNGVFAAVIDLSLLAKRYTRPMRANALGSVHLLDGQGNYIFHQDASFIGRNLFDRQRQAGPERLLLGGQMTNLLSGTGSFIDRKRPGTASTTRELISWNSVRLGEHRIVIALSASAVEVTAPLNHLRMQILWSGCVLGLAFLVMSVIFFRRRELARLRVSEEKYRRLVENIEEAVFTLDLNDRFTYVSPAVFHIAGYRPSELLGTSAAALIHPDDLPRMQDDRSLILKGLAAPHEFRILNKDGSIRYVQSNSRPVWTNNRVTEISGMLYDITQRKKEEEQRQRHADELRQLNEESKQFVFIVSHDLRTPLVNLKAYAHELRASIKNMGILLKPAKPHLKPPQALQLANLLDKEIPESLDFIGSSVTRLDRFINAVMSLARLGARELNPERLKMNELVGDILKNLAHKIEERSVQLIVHPLPTATADRMAMEQIMGNILTNAVNYLEPSRPGTIEVSGEQTPTGVAYRIRDNGRGIVAAEMSKLFAPFRRIGSPDVPGEGMGLAYVQTLVRRHGGRIACESTPGIGTTFIFTIACSTPTS